MFRLMFSHSSGCASSLIRYFTKSKYLSHTVGNFRIFSADVILESSEGGVDFAPAKYFVNHNIIEAIVRPVRGPLSTDEGMASHLSWLIDNYGKAEYDFLAAGAIGIMIRVKWLWKLIGKWLKKKLSRSKVHCTELWMLLLQHAGYEAVRGMDAQLTDPLTMLKALRASPSEFDFEKLEPGVAKELE